VKIESEEIINFTKNFLIKEKHINELKIEKTISNLLEADKFGLMTNTKSITGITDIREYLIPIQNFYTISDNLLNMLLTAGYDRQQQYFAC